MYLLTIDQSTSTTKAIIFDENFKLLGRYNKDHSQIYLDEGWIEHNPEEIYNNVIISIKKVIEKTGIKKEKIKVLSITNQRETTLIWDKSTGKPLCNAIVWNCNRAEHIVRRKKISDRAKEIAKKTGLTLSPYYCAAKASWIVENYETKNKDLMFGTVDTWLIWKLTGKHFTDYSNASRTQLFNINKLVWDKQLIELFGLKNVIFPKVKYSDDLFGETRVEGIFNKPVPICGIIGDSHGALFGQQCWQVGMCKCTLGTGGSVMMLIGNNPKYSSNGLATSIAWGIDGKIEYVLEGNINCIGDSLKWLKNEIGILPDSRCSEEYAVKVSSTRSVYFVPAFNGLGAPHYDSDARALICGLSRNSNRYHIIRAALESIAYQNKDVIESMLGDSGILIEELRVDGGPTNNEFLMQFMADMLDVRIIKMEIEELSALGAAYIGGLSIKLFEDREQLKVFRNNLKEYTRNISKLEAQELYHGWKDALRRTMLE